MMGGPSAGFVLDIPADPNWQPMDIPDVLDMDGYYAARIRSEKFVEQKGVWIAVELLDQDVAGKSVSKLLPDPRGTKKDTWFTWRTLMRSIGGMQAAQGAMRYTPGMFAQQLCWLRTAAYSDDSGGMRTGVDAWVSKEEYEQAVASKRHRWTPKPRGNNAGAPGSAGALPGGLPPAFPGMAGGLPGAPAAPTGFPQTQAFAPAPQAAAPMQPQQGFASPPPQQQTFQQPPAPAGTPPVQAQAGGFTFTPPAQPQQQQMAQPQQAVTQPTNGAPAPAAGSAFPGFPGGPGFTPPV
jgi:hypothetical protein